MINSAEPIIIYLYFRDRICVNRYILRGRFSTREPFNNISKLSALFLFKWRIVGGEIGTFSSWSCPGGFVEIVSKVRNNIYCGSNFLPWVPVINIPLLELLNEYKKCRESHIRYDSNKSHCEITHGWNSSVGFAMQLQEFLFRFVCYHCPSILGLSWVDISFSR